METTVVEPKAPIINAPVVDHPNVLDRLAEKSELKIKETQKVQAERKVASIAPEKVDSLGKVIETVADEPTKPEVQLSAEEQAKADLCC